MSQDKVLYDGDCPLCRSLAGFAGRHMPPGVRFLPWQEWKDSDEARQSLPPAPGERGPDVLRVLSGGALLEGDEAWAYLLERYPGLSSLSWLAGRLGLGRETARLLGRVGGAARRLCRQCGR